MAEYYAVERSPEYLAHYGIRGMKWGVRKAIASGNSRRLGRQYAKAQKKLAKLNKQADVGEQKKQQVKYAKRAAIGFGISGSGIGGVYGATALKKAARAKYDTRIKELMGNIGKHDRLIDPVSVETFVSKNPLAKKYAATYEKSSRALTDARKISGAIGLGGLGYAGYAGTRSLAAAYRQTPKGHAKAVSKRNEFQREMNKAFAGTKYANMPKTNSKKIKVINKNRRLGLPAVAVSNKPITASDRAALRKKYSRHK